MSREVEFLLMMALLFVGTLGWGDVVLGGADRLLGGVGPAIRSEFGQPVRVALGIALTLAVSGVLVAASVAYFFVLSGWLLVGAAVAIASRTRRLGEWWAGSPLNPTSVLVSLSALAVGLAAFGAATSGPYNANDDDAAYIYLAQRLLRTGGLVDPFNMRRISSYGGAEIFQALVLRTGGNSAGLGVEWFFFTLLCVALLVRSSTRRYAAVVIALVGLGLLAGQPVGTWANVAPTFSGAALTLALLQLLGLARRMPGAMALYGLAGLLVAALLSLRLEFAVPAGTAFVLSAVTSGSWKHRRRALSLGFGVGILATLGWAVGLQESSKSLLFPLEAGTWNTAFPWRDPALASFGQFLARIRGELAADHLGLELAALVVVAALLLSVRAARPAREGAAVMLFFVLGCLIDVVTETSALSGGTLTDVGRYDAPSALAGVLFAIDLLWCVAAGGTARQVAPAPGAAGARQGTRNLGAGLVAAALFLLATGGPLARYGPNLSAAFRAGASTLAGREGFADRWRFERARYTAVNAAVPARSHLLAAVDDPALLDFSRFSFATLDVVGAASPAPHVPLFLGERAVVSYLQRVGYNGIVASITDEPGLYSYAQWEKNTTSGIYDYRVMARYFLAWDRVLSGLSHDRSLHAYRVKTLDLFTWGPSARR